MKPPNCREKASLNSIDDLRKCLSYSCNLLLKRILAVSPAFTSQIVYKNAIKFGNTSSEEELLLGTVEAWSCIRLDCAVLLAPPIFLLAFLQMSLMCSVKLTWSSMFTPRILRLVVVWVFDYQCHWYTHPLLLCQCFEGLIIAKTCW